MKKYQIFRFIIPIFVFFGLIYSGFSQSITIKGIDPSGYPNVTATFVVKDDKGNEIRTPNFGQVQVKENGIDKTGTVYCADPGKTKFSIILTFDISTSMNIIDDPKTMLRRIDILRNVAHSVIKALPDPARWECAMTTFNNWGDYVQEFTNDRATLDSVINSSALDPRGGTDYNAGFLYDIRQPARPGGLLVARNAKFKPIVIFLTDGLHAGQASPPPSRTKIWIPEILAEAKDVTKKLSQTPATIYALTLGFPMPDDLKTIVSQTEPPGEAFQSSLNEDELRQILLDLVDKLGTMGSIPPCEVTWLTNCTGGGDVILSLPTFGIADTMNYTIPPQVKPVLTIAPNTLAYPNTKPNNFVEKNVVLTALNNNVTITGFTSKSGKYTVSDWGGTPPVFTIKKGENRTIKVKYLTTDSNFSASDIQFQSDACTTDSILAHGGWVFAEPFHCGSQKIDETKDVQQATFCNRTGDPMFIKTVQIKGGNKSDFVLVSPTGGIWLLHDSCMTIYIKFTPSSLGNRSSTYEIEDGNGVIYTAIVDGTGSGNPEIAALQNVTLPNASCITPSKTLDIDIKNSGAKDLIIASAPITGQDANDFTLVTNVVNMTITPGQTKQVTVKFQPLGYAGAKTATMTINSNAGVSPSFPITLNAKKDSVAFSVSKQKIDFGIICPNEDQTVTLDLTNTGDIALTVNADETAPFSLPAKTWTVQNNAPVSFVVHMQSVAEGTFTKNITFTDECNNKFVLEATGIVQKMSINPINIDLKTNVGAPKDTTVQLCNKSLRPLNISQVQIVGTSVFSILSPALPAPDWVLQPGACMDIKVRYSPTDANVTNAKITFTGSPCNFQDSITLFGNPALATADLAIDNTDGYVGQTIPVPVNLRNPFKVTESGATSFNTVFNYDQEVLKYISTTPAVTVVDNPGALTITGAPLSGIAGVMLTVNFQALPTPKTTSPLRLSGSKSVGGEVVFKEIPGVFTLKTATSSIRVGDGTAIAGQNVSLPIYLENVNNVTSFNQSINTELSFDATLLEPTDKTITDLGINAGTRTIKYSNLSVTPGADKIIGIANFRAMLGSAPSTAVRIAKSAVAVGKVDFTEVPGNFSLKELCQTPGGPRLFSPTGIAALLQITPNPSDGNMTIVYETIESGNTRLWISDILGTSTIELMNGESSQGVHDAKVDLGKLSSGRYVIILQTPTARYSKWIDIMK